MDRFLGTKLKLVSSEEEQHVVMLDKCCYH